MVLKQHDIDIQKMDLDTELKAVWKINSKWVMDLKVKCTTIKLLEGNLENLEDLRYGDDFLDMTPKVQSMKERIN